MKPTLPRVALLTLLLAVLITSLWLAFGEGGDPSSELASEGLAMTIDERALHSAPELALTSRDHFTTSRNEVETSLADDTASTVIDRELDLHGVVQDRDGKPIPGALVAAVAHPWRRVSVLNREGYDEERVLLETRSAIDGRFCMRLARGRSALLRVEAQGFARAEISECQAGERVVVTLQPGIMLEVLVRDEVGDAVPDVSVKFWRVNPAGSYDTRRGTTDAAGRCVLDSLPVGAGTLSCEHEVFGSPGWKQVKSLDAPRTTIEVVMPAGRIVRGRITDAQTKEPIANARVGANWVVGRAVRSQSDGSYEFLGWTGNGVNDLHVLAEGYGRVGKVVPPEGALDFELFRGDLARGRVLAATGVPIAGALITAIASAISRDGQEIDTCSAKSGADGRFEVTSLRRDLPHTLIVQAEGHARTLLDFDPLPEEPGTIELGDVVLAMPRCIAGVALDEKGAPLERARVALSGHNADRGRLRPNATAFAQQSYGAQEERHCDDLGRFRFSELSPGSYRLTLQLSGAPEVSQQVELSSELDLENVELRVPEGASLSVLVVDELDSPVVNASVSLHGLERRADARTDAVGWCAFRALPDAELIVSVYAGSEFLQAQVNEVRPTGQEIRVELQRVALLSGSVVDPSGKMIPDLGIEAVSESGKRHQGLCDAQGEFALPVAGGQNYILRLTGKSRTDLGNASRRGPVMLPIANDPSRWRGEIIGIAAPSSSIVLRAVEIDAHGAIDVRVEDPDGRPVEGARVLMTVGSSPTMLETNAHGLARFEKLTDEEVRFRASPPAAKSKLLSYSVMVTARPGKETVVLKLRVLEKLAGSVIDPDGLPAKDVFLTLYVDDVPTAGAESDAEGNFTFDAPRGTKYHITAQRQKAGEAALQGESAPFGTGSAPISIVLRR